MATPTTTTRHKRRKVAAILLLGLGVSSLGVASASHLTVTAQGDLVASGVATNVATFLGPNAKATLTVSYANNAGALQNAEVLKPTVTLSIDSAGATIPGDTTYNVYLYDNDGLTRTITATQNEVKEGKIDITDKALTTVDGHSVLPTYNRVAVVASSATGNVATGKQ